MSSTECPARVSSKSVLSRVSRKSVKKECQARVSCQDCSVKSVQQSVKQECLARVSSKSVKKECLARVSCQECPARKRFQECPARRCCSLMTVRVISTKKRQVFSFLRSFLCTLLYIKWLHSGSWVLSGFCFMRCWFFLLWWALVWQSIYFWKMQCFEKCSNCDQIWGTNFEANFGDSSLSSFLSRAPKIKSQKWAPKVGPKICPHFGIFFKCIALLFKKKGCQAREHQSKKKQPHMKQRIYRLFDILPVSILARNSSAMGRSHELTKFLPENVDWALKCNSLFFLLQ